MSVNHDNETPYISFNSLRHVMMTISEIALIICLVRKHLFEYVESIGKYRLQKRLSSFLSVSCVVVASSARYSPSRTPRRINASTRCLSAAVVYPHQAGDAYTEAWRWQLYCRLAVTLRRSCRGILELLLSISLIPVLHRTLPTSCSTVA